MYQSDPKMHGYSKNPWQLHIAKISNGHYVIGIARGVRPSAMSMVKRPIGYHGYISRPWDLALIPQLMGYKSKWRPTNNTPCRLGSEHICNLPRPARIRDISSTGQDM